MSSYVHALKTNDDSTALGCWTIKGAPVPAFKKDLATAALKLGMVAEKSAAKSCEYKILSETIDGKVAHVIVERTFLPQNKVTQIKVRLLIDEKAWKISQWGIH